MQRSSNEMAQGKLPGVYQLDGEGITMPAFSFEKISPPARSAPNAPGEKKQRGRIVQILDRLVEGRGRRGQKNDQTAPAEPEPE